MPTRSLKPCGKPFCKALTRDYYCDEHKKKDTDRASAHRRGYDGEWRKYRVGFIARNPLCIECLKEGIYTVATVVDHIIPHKGDRELFWDSKNHQALCTSHHNRKTAREDMGGWNSKEGLK